LQTKRCTNVCLPPRFLLLRCRLRCAASTHTHWLLLQTPARPHAKTSLNA
jgi:hypothetical protein